MNRMDSWVGAGAFWLWDKKEGGRRLREYRRLKRAQCDDPKALLDYQARRLTAILRHARDCSPWYRPVLEKAGIDLTRPVQLSELRKLPVTYKSDIRDHTHDFISEQYDKASLNQAKTGGSTGVSLNLYFDERCQQWRNAAQMYADNLAGWQPGRRVAAVWGNPPIATTFKQKLRSYLLERTIYLDTMDLNPSTMEAFVKQWRLFKPDVIFGHAHSIYMFAKFLLENDITDLRPRGIVATSMMLLDQERLSIEQAFSTKVTNRYGCEEVGLIAVECEHHRGMHINAQHIILECLDTNDQPVEPGQPGKLVITDLNNYAMPLIRYRVEDVGVLSDAKCPCGRTLPILERLEGRVADFIKKRDGGQVAGVSLVERTLTKVPGVEQMQLVQETLELIVVKRVKGQDFSEDTDILLISELRKVFDETIDIRIEDVQRIPQEASGKYRFSICKI